MRLFGTAGITVKVCQPAGAIVELVGRCFQLVRLGVLGDVDVLPMSRLGHGDIFDRQAATAGLRR